MIDTIIWDLDGTLLDTLQDLTDSVNFALKENSLPLRNATEIRRFLGNGIRNLLQQSVPENTPDDTFEQTFETFRNYYKFHCQEKTCPYDGIIAVLSLLKERNYKMAIVSNKVDDAVKELNKKFFNQYISVAIGEKDGLKRKPAPDMVFKAIEELGSKSENTVYIGDSEVDFETAKNAGIPCISVLWGFRDKSFLVERGAKNFATHPLDIMTLLSQKVLTIA